jgi:hypothetical protein
MSNFYVDFDIKVPNTDEAFALEAERELQALTAQHSDLIGAAVSLERIVESESHNVYQVRIVVYIRPQNMAVVKKNTSPMEALREALKGIEEKVRSSREKMAYVDQNREYEKHNISYELSAEEVYATYIKDSTPAEVFNQGRSKIATRLMVEERLNQEAAYIAADQILKVALQRINENK